MNYKYNRHLLVIYHMDCIDGLASAWAVHCKWGGDADVRLDYIPYGHHNIEEAENTIRGHLAGEGIAETMDVVFVDVAPTRAFLTELLTPPARAARVVVADHHKSAAEQLQGFAPPAGDGVPELHLRIDAKHPSAANMVWEYLFPDTLPPVFFKLIAKMDLGQNLLESENDYAAAALVDSKNITSIETAFQSFLAMSHLSMEDLVALGRNIMHDQDTRISKLDDNVMYAPLQLAEGAAPVWVPLVNADVQNFGRYISTWLVQLGEKTQSGLGGAWYVQGNGSVTISLRSDGAPDASAVAAYLCKAFGIRGGGHSTSAAVHFSSLAAFQQHIKLHSAAEMNRIHKSA
ncbi:MAG TPA: hypothetical protein PLW48_10175 [Alphaproteobacteria bacterium]|nr:hypothetical protein [Alphaproteobacteria bacterium]